MATVAPSAARRFAIAAPMPREPPVTSATFLSNLVMSGSYGFREPLLRADAALRGIPAIPHRNASIAQGAFFWSLFFTSATQARRPLLECMPKGQGG